jgi:hypothetical protein
MKNSDIGAIETTRNIQVSVVFNSGLASRDYEFSLRVMIPEFPDFARQRSDVYICVKHPIASPRQKQLKFRTWKRLEITTASVSEHGEGHCE